MRLTVKVRSLAIEIEIGDGKQVFSWLAIQAKIRYAKHFRLHPGSLMPTNLVDADSNPLWPHDTIVGAVVPNATVHLTLRDCIAPYASTSPNDQTHTLWEAFAASEAKDYRNVLFAVDLRRFDDPVDGKVEADDAMLESLDGNDAPQARPSSNVQLIGNFTNWRRKIPLIENPVSKGIYTAELQMPPDCELTFRFIVDERTVVSVAHTVVLDSLGMRLNIIHVPSKYHAGAATSKNFKPQSQPDMDLLKFGDMALGEFAQVRNLSYAEKRKKFNEDWVQIATNYLNFTAEQRRALKDVLWEHQELLSQIFKIYAASGENNDDMTKMSNIEFWNLCQRCRIPTPRLTLKQITEIFFNINSSASRLGFSSDSSNPDNQFVQHEMYEGLVRIAEVKYPRVTPASAMETLMAYHIKPYALRALDGNAIRTHIVERSVQEVYLEYSSDLRNMFSAYCIKDDVASPDAARSCSTINFNEFKMLLSDHNLAVDGRATKTNAAVFIGSQGAASDDNPMTELVYAEYLEAMSRIADARFREKIPLASKLERLLSEVFFKHHVPSIKNEHVLTTAPTLTPALSSV